MNIILKRLTLTNYRNIKHQDVIFDGSCKIVGENRIGKTNTIEALYWLLTDKLLNGSSDIEQIKPLDDTKAKVSVFAEFDVDGVTITLEKQFQEEWVKTRGTNNLEFKGHSTTYFYNGTKQQTKKIYDTLLSTDFNVPKDAFQGIDVFQMLINPLYLGKMGDTDQWKNLRALIISIVGDVSDDDVFASFPKLAPIQKDLETMRGRTDQLTKLYNDERKSLQEEIIKDDAIIDNLEKDDQYPSPEMVETAKKGIEECNAKLAALKSDNSDAHAINMIDDEIREIQNEIIDLKKKDLEKQNANPNEVRKKELQDKKSELLTQVQTLTIKNTSILANIKEIEYLISNEQKEVDACISKRKDLIDELNKIDENIQNPTFASECPTCHRKYDDATLEENRKHVISVLTNRKESLIEEGKKNNNVRDTHLRNIENYKTQLEGFNKDLSLNKDSLSILATNIRDIDDELETLSFVPKGVVENPRIKELESLIQNKELEKAEIRTSAMKQQESINSLYTAEIEKRDSFQAIINADIIHQHNIENIAHTKTKKENDTAKLLLVESKIEITKLFVKEKLAMLDDHISSVFGDIKFMLIEPQVNGGYSTVCKPYIKGTNVLYKSGSKSEQLTTGVAIADKIKKHLNLPNLPFIFDEGGEVSTDTFINKFDTESQLICVKVEDNIKVPTIIKI